MLLEKIEGPLRERIPLGDPEVPADVGVDVVGFETHCVENTKGLVQDNFPDPVAGHGHHGMACHRRFDSSSSS